LSAQGSAAERATKERRVRDMGNIVPRNRCLKWSYGYDYGHDIIREESEMKKIPAGQFKAKCLSIMDRVQRTGESVLITKRGKPVARLLPAETEPEDVFGYMAGKVKIVGDIVGPITPLEDWETK
jgi:prevent-host-death family protein